MYSYVHITQVHFEITDKCNAACPQCPRSDHGGLVNPGLPLTELTLQDVQAIFPPDFVQQLRHMYACGNHGDPIVARDCVAIFQYLRDCNPDLRLGIHTNGGVRSLEFWQALGRLMPKGKGYVRFGIDGLEDTNHLYRRNVRWPILMRNVQAFIAAGGNAEWNYLVFRHNEHQVEAARQLAHDLGFSLFNAKKTGRFVDYRKMEYLEATPIKGRDGEIVGQLERPLDPAYQNRALDGLRDLERRYGDMQGYLDAARIQCKVEAERSVYVSCDGHVLPCCWLGGHIHGTGGAARRQFLAMLEPLGGTAHIDARRRSIRAIVQDELFQRSLPGSWGKSSCSAGKPITCARVCGQEFDRRTAQGSANRRPAQAPGRETAAPLQAPAAQAPATALPGGGAALLNLAEIYRDGRDVDQDYQAALRCYLALLEEEASPILLYHVGELYRTGGPGLTKDEAMAVGWFRKAADQGSTSGQYRLGEAYRTGRGVERDPGQAARFYEMAARSGHPWAQYRLGESFRTGRGRAADVAAAELWLRRSAEAGNARAMLTLGDLLAAGEGVAQDPAEAAEWYRRAARSGSAEGHERLIATGNAMMAAEP